MITITGNGRLTRTPELRCTRSGKTVTTLSIASDRRNSDQPQYVDLILWEAQAEAAAKHLVKGQAVSFTGRPDIRPYSRSNGDPAATLEIHGVDLEYGPKPRERSQDETPAQAVA